MTYDFAVNNSTLHQYPNVQANSKDLLELEIVLSLNGSTTM